MPEPISESLFSVSEALGAIKLIAISLIEADELNDDERRVAGKILQEARFTLETERIERDDSICTEELDD